MNIDQELSLTLFMGTTAEMSRSTPFCHAGRRDGWSGTAAGTHVSASAQHKSESSKRAQTAWSRSGTAARAAEDEEGELALLSANEAARACSRTHAPE